MGRLTDNILTLLGLKPSDRVSFDAESNDRKTYSPSHKAFDPEIQKEIRLREQKAFFQLGVENPGLDEEKKSQIKAAGAANETTPKSNVPEMEVEKDTSLRIPNSDCAGCRATGVLVLYGGAAYIMRIYYKTKHRYSGKNFAKYTLFSAITSGTLIITGTCRLFNIGPFNPDNAGRKYQEVIQEDKNYFAKQWDAFVKLLQP